MDKATMQNLRRFNEMLFHDEDLNEKEFFHEDSDRDDRPRDGADDRILPTLCSTCSYLATNYGTSTARGELGTNVVHSWRKHVDRFHPENEALSKSIATLEGLLDQRGH